MKRITCHNKRLRFAYIKSTILALFFCLLLMNGYVRLEESGNNYFHITLNGVEVGTLAEEDQAERLLITARRNIASLSEELVFMEADMAVTGEEVLWGKIDDEEDVIARMEEVLRDNIHETMHRAYTVKMNEYMVSLSNAEEAAVLLQTAVDKYDSEGKFSVELVYDTKREFSVLTTQIMENVEQEDDHIGDMEGGVQVLMSQIGTYEDENAEKELQDYDTGLMNVDFAEEVEIVEAYLPESQLTDLETAVEQVIKEQEKPGEYEVVDGDTLSEISIKVNIPMDDIIAMNSDILENENSTLHVGDKLIITVPEPELSVERTERIYLEESYDAEVIYIDRDDWYTTQTREVQAPSAGFRKIVADVHYLNDKETSREILKQEIVMEAVPKKVERGTKIPPNYTRPISGGRKSSGFGRRPRPTAGASSYHKGIDWSVPTGTAVYASCGGTVAKAGWSGGYGYAVYINHEGGTQTRYAHLSKVLVKAGQHVKQGERIALSGNTGVSTGPHLHFEILIGGTQVNPENYIDKKY